KPARDLAVGGFEPIATRGLRIEIGGELRAVGTERLNLGGELVLAMVGLTPAFRRCLERIECRGQAPARCVDCARVPHNYLRGRRANVGKYLPQQGVAAESVSV